LSGEGSRHELSGWKQIASHLGVSEPTARNYYKEGGLPVYRRGRLYYAFPEELDSWLRRQRVAPERKQGGGLQNRWIAAGLTALLSTAIVLFLFRSLRFPGVPDQVLLEGTVLIVEDEGGRVLWQKETSRFLPSGSAKSPVHWLIEDFDGDSRNEIAVTLRPANSRAETSKVICFDHDGDLLWEFVNGRALTVRGRYFEPFFEGQMLTWLETTAGSFILNVAAHTTWYPTQVTLLDPRTGLPAQEYWHPGRVSTVEICDIDEDGEAELYLGGTNNPGFGTGHPSLAVLALPKPGEPIPVQDTFFREGNPRELEYILFPLYDAFSIQEMGASPRLMECQGPGRLMLAIGERLQNSVYVYLNADLEVEDIRPSEGFIQLHKKLYIEGFLDHAYHPQELAGWRKAVKFPALPDGNSAEVQKLFH